MPAGVLEVAKFAAKAVLLLALLGLLSKGVGAAAASTASSPTASANLGNVNLQGSRKPGDQLLFEYRVTRRAKPFKVHTVPVHFRGSAQL